MDLKLVLYNNQFRFDYLKSNCIKNLAFTIAFCALSSIALPLEAATFSSFENSNSIGDEYNMGKTIFDSSSNYLNKDLEKYLRFFEQSNILDKSDNEAHNLAKKAVVFLRSGNKQQGIEYLNQAWEADKKLSSAGVMLSLIYLQEKNLKKLLETTAKLKKRDPDLAKTYMLEGIAYMQQNDMPKAEQAFKEAYHQNPNDIEIIRNYAELQLSIGNIDQAKKIYQDVLIKFPGDLSTLLTLAQFELDNNNVEQTLKLLQDAIKYNPDKLYPYTLLARMSLAYGDKKQSDRVITVAVEKFPKDIRTKELASYIYLQNRRPDKSIKLLNSVIKSSPPSVTPHYLLALAYEEINENGKALNETKKGLSLDSEHVPTRFVQARIFAKQGEYEAANVILIQLVDEFPKRTESLQLLAQIALKQKRPDQAVEYLRKALVISDSRTVTLQLASALKLSGAESEGFNTLIDWSKKYPKDIQIKSILANSYFAHGKYQQAEELYLEILTVKPEHLVTLNNLAMLLSQQGKDKRALSYAEKAHSLAPKNPNLMDTLGVIYLNDGQLVNAEKWLTKARRLLPEDPSVRYHWAQYLAQSKQSDRAQKALQAILNEKVVFSEKNEAEQLYKQLQTQ